MLRPIQELLHINGPDIVINTSPTTHIALTLINPLSTLKPIRFTQRERHLHPDDRSHQHFEQILPPLDFYVILRFLPPQLFTHLKPVSTVLLPETIIGLLRSWPSPCPTIANETSNQHQPPTIRTVPTNFQRQNFHPTAATNKMTPC
jgi:hypothetical protein